MQDRKLVINGNEAKTVQSLFALYRQLGTMRRLKEQADRREIVTKIRRNRNGVRMGGKPFTRGNLYQLLRNPLYIGQIPHNGKTYPAPDPRLCRAVANAHRWFRQLKVGDRTSIRAIAKTEGLHECDVSRTLRLAFLAPDIVEAILDGRQPVDLTAETLRRMPRIPANWAEQRRQLGFTGR